MLNQYFKNIYKTYKTGDTTEPSYYPDLKILIEDFLKSKGKVANITVQARKIAAGIPDFTIRKGKELIGYIEAKDLSIENLETIEGTEQIERYKKNLPNFILTNYFDFWLWRKTGDKGQWIKKVRIGMPIVLKINHPPVPQKEEPFFDLINTFITFNIPEKKTAKSLAQELAVRARMLPGFIKDLLDDKKEEEIDQIYNAFKEFLISDLSKEDFADIYAQTITYGLFTARLRHDGAEKFNRFMAQQLVPKNIQILHDTFSLISSQALPEHIEWIVDDIATVLAYADMDKIKKELHQEIGGGDPLMYFYETFLAEYDSKKRKARGVYYTPLPVVSYITRSINILLKEKFDKKFGFADSDVTLLDPASGTLTFPANAIRIAKEEVDKSSSAGSWLQIVRNHILKDYYAFELLMAPYIIGHLKAFLLLEDFGYKMENHDRFQLYLTNTLDFSEIQQSQLPFVAGLSEEAKKAKKVKENTPVLVIMGNPPYSVSHSEQLDFIKDKMKDYLTGLGVEKEKKKGVMQDDYIRFIRFAHWKIEQTGQGIIGMITNNSYLDGIIHRAMRKKILDDFDEIYILNLHGNSRLKEKTPEGGKDENVFDIQQGVGIILLVKTGENKKTIIKYAEKYGLREEKYKFLEIKDIKNTEWRELEQKEPNYFFVPKNMKGEGGYQKFISLEEIFTKDGSGVITRRDNFTVSTSKAELKNRVSIFINMDLPKEIIESSLGIKDSPEWLLEKARQELSEDENLDEKYLEYLYRPFDKRWILYHEAVISRPSALLREVFVNRDNIGLICSRRTPTGVNFNHVFVSDLLADIHSAADQSYVFPLFIYGDSKKQKLLFDDFAKQRVNFSDKLWQSVPTGIEPEKVFYYIYTILYSNIYRHKYNVFLKIDFPRIPFTKDEKLFNKIAKLGKELVDLHLLKSEKLENISASFPIKGDSRVTKREYNEKVGRLYINEAQYFGTITPQVWNYYIGGYQVLDKWLKDRADKVLSAEDVNHFLKVITALNWTIYFQKEIDKIYPEIEKSLIK